MAKHVVPGGTQAPLCPGAVLISEGRIVDLGPPRGLRQKYPQTDVMDLGDAILLPGFVNAHQHGRGLSQIQLGYPDDQLEPWIARRRGRGVPDAYLLTRLAAQSMLANGVTATLHANYSYGSGDYEAELRGVLRAYDEAGLRATVCVGFADRGGLIYPPADETAFRETLSLGAQALLAKAKPAYLPLDATLNLMDRLLAEYANHPTISLAYGPAGPQWVSDRAWREIASHAAGTGAGIHFHLLESPAQRQAADALYPEGVLTRLEHLGLFETSVSAAHFVQARPADIAAALRLGLVIVANPGANMRLHNGVPALADWREAGLPIALGTDNCGLDDNEDYLSELRLGGLLARGTGASTAGASSRFALAMGTRNGAKAIFQPDCGLIDRGCRADLIALDPSKARGVYLDPDCDLLDLVIARCTGDDTLMTMVEGEVRYQRGDPAGKTSGDAARMATAVRLAGPDAPSKASEIATALHTHINEAGY
ncbi:amidohydrolase family protein [Pseudoruegeria sp. SK021]|uniref:amidohydrolase family protein n=1 Tax=Pseudoruegeria sp. SK021 TaxID=1933035 RepID=UPI001F0AE5B6|nr:amidohydrolase family protein [Pseudoruegeria sp. SK021]